MTSRQIEIFLAVGQHSSFTLAADALYLSQPTVSRQISLLEEELDVTLFVRGNNYVRMTPEGMVLTNAFRKMKHIFDKEMKTAKAVKEGHMGSLTVGFISDMDIPDFFLRGIDLFRKKYPGVTVDYVGKPKTNFAQDLCSHTIDMILGHEMEFQTYPNLLSEHIADTQMGIYYGARHTLANKTDLSVADFKDETIWTIRIADTPERRNMIKKVTDFYGIPEFRIQLTDSTNEIMFHLRLGEGACIMDSFVLNELPQDVRILPFDPQISTVHISLFWDKENLNPCIPQFADILKNVVT